MEEISQKIKRKGIELIHAGLDNSLITDFNYRKMLDNSEFLTTFGEIFHFVLKPNVSKQDFELLEETIHNCIRHSFLLPQNQNWTALNSHFLRYIKEDVIQKDITKYGQETPQILANGLLMLFQLRSPIGDFFEISDSQVIEFIIKSKSSHYVPDSRYTDFYIQLWYFLKIRHGIYSYISCDQIPITLDEIDYLYDYFIDVYRNAIIFNIENYDRNSISSGDNVKLILRLKKFKPFLALFRGSNGLLQTDAEDAYQYCYRSGIMAKKEDVCDYIDIVIKKFIEEVDKDSQLPRSRIRKIVV